MAEALRFDPVTGSAIPDGPFAVGTTEDLRGLATAVVVRHGVPFAAARLLVRQTMSAEGGLIQPKGDVALTWARLKESGLMLGIVTGDDRAATLRVVKELGITDLLDGLVCGDDDVPDKPHPGALEALGDIMGVTPKDMVMVGDTATDLAVGRAAGVAGCIGVSGGAGSQHELTVLADVIISSIDELAVLTFPGIEDEGEHNVPLLG